MMTQQEVRQTIVGTIRRYLPVGRVKIYLFGSRAEGRPTPASDFDIALDAGTRIDGATLSHIRQDLEDSHIPYRVDVVDVARMSGDFRSIALPRAVPW